MQSTASLPMGCAQTVLEYGGHYLLPARVLSKRWKSSDRSPVFGRVGPKPDTSSPTSDPVKLTLLACSAERIGFGHAPLPGSWLHTIVHGARCRT